MLKSIIIVCIFLGYLQLAIAVTIYGHCTTPSNEVSTCIELFDCKPLYDLIQKPGLSFEERDFLQKSQCGYKDENVLVCCPPPLIPQPPSCGNYFDDRLVGGNITAIDEYPWMALIEYTKPGNVRSFLCGGSLINNRYVITAAHCVERDSKEWSITGVRLGEWNLTTNPDCEVDIRGKESCSPEYIYVNVEKQIAHPEYNTDSNENDIALLRLAKKIIMNKFINPICLPFQSHFRNKIFTDREMNISGWGATKTEIMSKIKLKATITVWDFELCKEKYKSIGITLGSSMMCAGGASGIDTCSGDSGGPLISEETTTSGMSFFLMGVVSFGYRCGVNGWPGVYTRIINYLDWIENNIEA